MTLRRVTSPCVLLLSAAALNISLFAATPAESAFKKLQSLAGQWEGKDAHGMAAKTSFEALASGTAVLERLDASGMEEMVTLYSVDRDGIALVHYCPTNNQPRMRVVPSANDIQELSFDYQGAGNLKSPDAGHQHHLVIRFDDADHITETWTWRAGGKDTPMVFHFTRKKP
ncbi:MAG TPA: hypothetical protein VE263_02250 [Candidatus Angelobacter sp.]|nr:hypothetical protein [Candidatus Angelobacter sp.]